MSLTNLQVGAWNVAGLGPSAAMNTGNTFFLSSGRGSDSNDGSKETPFATLDKALGACTANNDDRIYPMANHAETTTGAGGITLDKAGVSIIGLGRYDARPRFLIDGAAASALVTAANVEVANCVFASGHSDLAYAFLVTAKGFKISHCLFEDNTTDENFVSAIQAGAADNDCDGIEIIGNVFNFGVDNGTLYPLYFVKDSNDIKVIGNRIYLLGDTAQYAAIYSVSTEIHYNAEIAWNYIANTHTANATLGVSFGSAGSTGVIHNNYCYGLDVAGATPFVTAATGISLFNNLYSHVGSTTQGYPAPAVGALA